MVLAATGAVDFPALVADARRLCGDWPARPVAARGSPAAIVPAAARESLARIVRPAAALEYAVRMTAGPAETHGDRFAAKLLATVLGDSSGSRLYWDMVDSGAAEQATLHHQEFLDAGLFVTQLSCDAADVDHLLERILGIYREVAARGLDRAEFEQARNKLAGRVVLAGERPRRRLFEVGGEWAHAGVYRSVADSLAIVDGLTRDDLQRVLTTWHLAGPAATVVAGPAA
jgi:predicted Zn-dependent peptidase